MGDNSMYKVRDVEYHQSCIINDCKVDTENGKSWIKAENMILQSDFDAGKNFENTFK